MVLISGTVVYYSLKFFCSVIVVLSGGVLYMIVPGREVRTWISSSFLGAHSTREVKYST